MENVDINISKFKESAISCKFGVWTEDWEKIKSLYEGDLQDESNT